MKRDQNRRKSIATATSAAIFLVSGCATADHDSALSGDDEQTHAKDLRVQETYQVKPMGQKDTRNKQTIPAVQIPYIVTYGDQAPERIQALAAQEIREADLASVVSQYQLQTLEEDPAAQRYLVQFQKGPRKVATVGAFEVCILATLLRHGIVVDAMSEHARQMYAKASADQVLAIAEEKLHKRDPARSWIYETIDLRVANADYRLLDEKQTP